MRPQENLAPNVERLNWHSSCLPAPVLYQPYASEILNVLISAAKHLWINPLRLSGCGMSTQLTRISFTEQLSYQWRTDIARGWRREADTDTCGRKKKNTWSRPNNSASFLVTGHKSLRKQEKRKKSEQKEEKWEQALESSSFSTSLPWCSEGSQILSKVSPFLCKLAQDGFRFTHESAHNADTHTPAQWT